MKFLDLFAGIGGFRRGLERSGHTCAGHVEIDKYANKSYMAMYGLEACPHGADTGANSYNMCSREVRKNCDGKTCKGEWYAKDIKQIRAGEIPKAEIWTFGFPCTDVSISGRMAGIHGERSGLFFTVAGLLKGTAPEDKPRFLVVENVKHLVSSERGAAFTAVLFELWEAGYDCEWCVVNSKEFHTAQHRERVYIIGHLGDGRAGEIFPIGGANAASVKRLIDGTQGNRVYDPGGASVTLTAHSGGLGGKTGLYVVSVNRKEGITEGLEQARCLMAQPICCHGAGLPIRESKKSGYTMAHHGDGLNLACPNSTLSRIRRLTPKECFRLQAFDDFLFDRARGTGISDAQLYKQAGNAVTVNVVYEIGLRLAQTGGDI